MKAPATAAGLPPLLARIGTLARLLQAAVTLLFIFSVVLAIGTMLESWYSAKVSQELVYRAWWFTLLLGLLWVNIFFAAAKKWPWKKYQTGFLITHVGLLTMCTGGIVTSLRGTDSMMNLIDTPNESVMEREEILDSFGRLMNKSSSVVLQEDAMISVTAAKRGDAVPVKQLEKPFDPGSFIWKTEKDAHGTSDFGKLLNFMSWLSHPLPRHWRMELPDGAELKVLAFYPNVRVELADRA